MMNVLTSKQSNSPKASFNTSDRLLINEHKNDYQKYPKEKWASVLGICEKLLKLSTNKQNKHNLQLKIIALKELMVMDLITRNSNEHDRT